MPNTSPDYSESLDSFPEKPKPKLNRKYLAFALIAIALSIGGVYAATLWTSPHLIVTTSDLTVTSGWTSNSTTPAGTPYSFSLSVHNPNNIPVTRTITINIINPSLTATFTINGAGYTEGTPYTVSNIPAGSTVTLNVIMTPNMEGDYQLQVTSP